VCSTQGLHEGLIKSGIAVNNDVLTAFYEIDVDKSNTITFEEFCGYLVRLRNRTQK
jgi:hypothetical protein